MPLARPLAQLLPSPAGAASIDTVEEIATHRFHGGVTAPRNKNLSPGLQPPEGKLPT